MAPINSKGIHMKSYIKTLLTLVLSAIVTFYVGTAEAKVNVLAGEPTWAALTQELGGNLVDVSSATQALQDPHHIQARPSLIAKARRADLLIYSGAELEIGWLPILLRQAGNAKIQPGTNGHLEASKYVDLLEVPTRLSRGEGDIHPQGNPHIHTDPRNIQRVADELSRRLALVDPAHTSQYRTRHDDFTQRWQAAIAKWQRQAAPIKGMPIVVHHKSWVYLEHWLGLKEVAELEPKPGVQPSVAHLQEVLNALKIMPAKAIVHLPYFDGKASKWLSSRTGIPVVVLPGAVGGTDAATNLFTTFDDTINKLVQANQ